MGSIELITAVLLASAWVGVEPDQPAPDPLEGSCTIVNGSCTIANLCDKAPIGGRTLFAGYPVTQRSRLVTGPVTQGSRLVTGPDSGVALCVALYLKADRSRAAVYLDPDTELHVSPGGRRALHLRQGSLVVYYAGGDARLKAPPLVVTTAHGSVRLWRGWLQAIVRGGTVTFALGQDQTKALDGTFPSDADAKHVGGGPLDHDGDALAEMQGRVRKIHMARARRAAKDRWLRQAVAGDIVPAIATAQPVGPNVRRDGRGKVAQAAEIAVVTSPAVATGTGPARVLTRSEALIESRDPASVLVGTRLQRTRIVGNPGTASGQTGVRINPEVRPLRLSTPR